MLIKFVIFGIIGWCMEIIWTGLSSFLKGDYRLVSSTSLWMFFIYGLAAFLEPLCDCIIDFPLVVRGIIYVLCIFTVEYVFGVILLKFNLCPWDYSSSKFNIKGIIRLDYAPVWFVVGLLFEFVHKSIAHQ